MYRMWETIRLESGGMVQHLKTFAEGAEEGVIKNLVPDCDIVTPNKSGPPLGYRGWAFCARTSDYEILLCYFEKDCPQVVVRGLSPGAAYTSTWFDPRSGSWMEDEQVLMADSGGGIKLPTYPLADDNALRLQRYSPP